MNGAEIITHLRTMEPAFRSAGVDALYLFGSRARGDGRPDSDVDLAFESHDSRFDLWERAGMLAVLSKTFGLSVDLVDRHRLRPQFKPFIEPDLVRVF